MTVMSNGLRLGLRHELWLRELRFFDRRGEELEEDDCVLVVGHGVRDTFMQRDIRAYGGLLQRTYFDRIDYPHGEWEPGVVAVQMMTTPDMAAQWLMRWEANSWLYRQMRILSLIHI